MPDDVKVANGRHGDKNSGIFAGLARQVFYLASKLPDKAMDAKAWFWEDRGTKRGRKMILGAALVASLLYQGNRFYDATTSIKQNDSFYSKGVAMTLKDAEGRKTKRANRLLTKSNEDRDRFAAQLAEERKLKERYSKNPSAEDIAFCSQENLKAVANARVRRNSNGTYTLTELSGESEMLSTPYVNPDRLSDCLLFTGLEKVFEQLGENEDGVNVWAAEDSQLYRGSKLNVKYSKSSGMLQKTYTDRVDGRESYLGLSLSQVKKLEDHIIRKE